MPPLQRRVGKNAMSPLVILKSCGAEKKFTCKTVKFFKQWHKRNNFSRIKLML